MWVVQKDIAEHPKVSVSSLPTIISLYFRRKPFYICGNLGARKLFNLTFSCCVEALENLITEIVCAVILKDIFIKNMILPELC